jgi:hypothetical protein
LARVDDRRSNKGTRKANRGVGDEPKTRPPVTLRSEPTDNTANNKNDTKILQIEKILF